MDDIIEGNIQKSSRPLVAVTFDDGYLDNFTNAAPILRRYGIPCAFFVSTGIVGTSRAFEHDLEKLGRAVPTMSWDHIGELYAQGFTIGSHTVSHVNLAKVSRQRALEELGESRDTLRRRLGMSRIAIAYPFGQRSDISIDGLALIRDAGYMACFSGYGGVNWSESLNLYDLKRSNVDFRFTLNAVRARIEGWPSIRV
jgi:peptidoglycan/xylan/chitin deacetylase (PgdA/CDA1 family)